jgi:uncharacterized protein YdeI (YjbR/CyaY-like superfamily)
MPGVGGDSCRDHIMVDWMDNELHIMTFENGIELRTWLAEHHSNSEGVWVRIFSKHAAVPTVTFEELLDEGLCFGWSESMRRKYDQDSYLQRFTPRKTVGTKSRRNLERVRELVKNGRMTSSGLKALGMDE